MKGKEGYTFLLERSIVSNCLLVLEDDYPYSHVMSAICRPLSSSSLNVTTLISASLQQLFNLSTTKKSDTLINKITVFNIIRTLHGI